jgi:alcohol dehydrogenase class IV
MDALTHAIEGYITKGAWEMSDMFHIKAIELIAKSLRGAVENTDEGREGMALGQYIAGMGFSNVGLGIVHSMAHPLGALYDTPHGVANAIILPTVMEYNAPETGEKYRNIAKAMGVEGTDAMTLEEARKAAELKKEAEYATRKAEVDAAFDYAYELREKFLKDYGSYTYSKTVSNSRGWMEPWGWLL